MGQITRAILIDAPDEHSAVLGIRLHPAGAYGVFGHPIQELTGGSVDLADLMAEATEQLAERCSSVTSVEGLMRVGAAWVERRAPRALASCRRDAFICEEISGEGRLPARVPPQTHD